MKKTFFLMVFGLIGMFFCNAQNTSLLWEGHFSYLNIKDVVSSEEKIYAASENAVFSYDLQTNELEEISTIHGLSGEQISTIYFSDHFELLLIGYENGLVEIYNDATKEVTTVVDILDKITIPPNNKRVNHFSELNDYVYISADYGISVYDISRLEFGDTYFIGNGGSQIKVNQSTIFNGYIYAACEDNEAIKRGLLSSSNLIDFQEWEQISTGNFNGIEAIENKLYCTSTNRRVYEIDNTTLNQLFVYPNQPLDLKTRNNQLLVATQNSVYVYDANFVLLANPILTSEYNTTFTSATVSQEGIYIGTKNFGVLETMQTNVSSFLEIHPDGPLQNSIFSLESGFGSVWASFGDYTRFYNPGPFKRAGVSQLYDEQWNNIPYDEVFGLRNLNAISINPLNPQQVFVSSFHDGMLEINDGIATQRLDETNSGLESLIYPPDPNYKSIRVSGTTFDDNGVLWSLTGLVERPLKAFDPSSNSWRSFDFTELIPEVDDNIGFSELLLAPSGDIFIASFSYGVIGFKHNGGNQIFKNVDKENGNLPDKSVRAIALDKGGQLWIGTDMGLRVLYNTSGFFSDDNLTTDEIVILDNGIPKELLQDQFISDIKVDGSNNKWIATIGAGLFYFSPDGQQTIYHFTKDNSPLPSNNVNDVTIDSNNGVVYIGTDKGLVSFKSGGSAPTDELVDAYAYPNPVRPGFNITTEKIKIKDITDNVNIKITDIEGNLVAEAQSKTNSRYRGYNLEIDGGTAYWNGKNMANNTVASGVYLVMISDMETLETKVLKLMIVR
ncbi:type IX secretion system anionic LPS delivery protein PorZ [Pontimicrobium aquaticum]|uniref:ABC transporter substrate-binding protein n=1 Tax=Pontimicrobium aquaticum TaxID=2565367 RepID=A0A4U0F160_9FLAO|nr:two-component regulator propeller domain-containing protein [Pontimicrobium aquaticum]TJY38136.1 ABC transporter substrate-binding protein [Pontimicrobium aquaticum]